MKHLLITGGAGFIGSYLAGEFAAQNIPKIILLDNINDYYTVDLKYKRLENLGFNQNEIGENKAVKSRLHPNLIFIKSDIARFTDLNKIIADYQVDFIIHLAAQAGVRYSIEQPEAYTRSNTLGFFNMVEVARQNGIRKIVYASSSSVYGNSARVPFSESTPVNAPESYYAATKIGNELTAHSYAKVYGMQFIGLRFFTVYGALGRPDMAYYAFTKSILEQKTIRIFNRGELWRDFTYIDDIVKSIRLTADKFDAQETENYFSEIFNIGGGQMVKLSRFVEILEELIGKKAVKEYVDMQKGDVFKTCADASKLENYIKFKPQVNIKEGLEKFVKWFMQFHRF